MSSGDPKDLKRVGERMDKAVAALKEEFGGLRSGRLRTPATDQGARLHPRVHASAVHKGTAV